MDYTDLSVEELASDERFINWVKNNCSDAEKDFWRLLVLSNPGFQDKVNLARILVMNIDRAEDRIDPVSPGKIREIWQNVLAGIDEDSDVIAHRPLKTIRKRQFSAFPQSKNKLAILVVSLAVLLTFGLYIFSNDPDNSFVAYSYQHDAPGFTEFINTTSQPVQLTILDGSVISVQANSRVKYKQDYTFDTIRNVYLEGKAFFDVARDPKKPFVVLTNDVATKVLGTSFWINGDASTKDVIVKVKTGKVSVYSVKSKSQKFDDPKNGVILLPNQEVTYKNEAGLFEKKIVEVPELLAPTSDHDFVFKHAPIDTVFKKLEDAYGVEILFDRETMKNCFLTAPLGSEPLFEKLNVICRTIGASYEVIDAKVVISSTGCKIYNR
jgi:transmembrane sensor